MTHLKFIHICSVQRPTQIKIRAQDLSGERMDVTFEGWQARIFQHEFDHLQVRLLPASTSLKGS